MLWALCNDLAQRLLTSNKREQRANLCRVFQKVGYATGASVLDYECGTGLFAPTLASAELKYVGYDIDQRFVEYGRFLNPSLAFTHEKKEVAARAPYDFVLANCCFHHISDADLPRELEFIRSVVQSAGYFVLVDLLSPSGKRSALWRAYGVFERGQFIRSHTDHVRLVEPQFEIVTSEVVRAHLLSIPGPLYSDLGIYVCQPRRREGQTWT